MEDIIQRIEDAVHTLDSMAYSHGLKNGQAIGSDPMDLLRRLDARHQLRELVKALATMATKEDPVPVVEQLSDIPSAANPYAHDAYNMGMRFSEEIEMMFANHSNETADFLILVHRPTGKRVKIHLNEVFGFKNYDKHFMQGRKDFSAP